jgi:hypothetical protein
VLHHDWQAKFSLQSTQEKATPMTSRANIPSYKTQNGNIKKSQSIFNGIAKITHEILLHSQQYL